MSGDKVPFGDSFLQPGGALRGRLWRELSGDLAARAALPAGARVGAYSVLEEIGRGGMGAVYLAERADGQFQQRVALKLLKPGMETDEVVRRFELERQILASLQHPAIARLYDGGVTPEGRPYFVMEHVEGVPIDRYCDDRRLNVEDRLRLFTKVAAAVQHAHRSLVVHRDLKPSNILVTADGEAKLLDFGIAKLLEAGSASGLPPVTRATARVMTPEYASPEQIRGERITTASDVYQLGLLLYELLTGRRAHGLDGRTIGEIEQAICETAPQAPSAAVTAGRGALPGPDPAVAEGGWRAETAAHLRRSTPERLRRRLAGDLDTIVLTALRKEPERRYASVAAFSEDLRRHLEGLPVVAHKDSLRYRARKFVGRHRLGLLAAGLVLASLLAGLVGTTIQARRATEAARRAEEVTAFLVDLLELADPETAQGRDVTVKEVLEHASFRIRTELKTQPRLQATLQTLVARLHVQLGELDTAEQQTRAALARREQLLGQRHPEVAQSRLLLAQVLAAKGRHVEAEAAARASLDIRVAAFGAEHPAVAESWSVVGETLEKQGRFAEAREAFRKALAIQRRRLGRQDAAVADTLYRWGFSEVQDGNYREAERLYRESLEIRRVLAEGKSLDVANSLHSLAFTLVRLGRYEEAQAKVQEAVGLARELLGSEHPALADMLGTLAIVLHRMGDDAGAEKAHLDALRIVTTSLGPEHPNVALILNNLGVLRHAQERYREAAEFYARSVELRRRVLGRDHPLVGTTLSFQAFALHRAGDPQAEALYRESRDRLVASRGPDHPDVANVQNDLGRLLADTQRAPEAEALLRRALATRRRVFGRDDQHTVTTSMNLGRALDGLGRHGEAEQLLRDARSWRARKLGDEGWEVVEANLLLADCLGRQGRLEEARRLLERSRARVEAAKDTDHWLARLARDVGARLAADGRAASR